MDKSFKDNGDSGGFSASAKSPNLNNMGGPNPQGNKTPDISGFWCGLDWLSLTLFVDWGGNWSTAATDEKKWVGEGARKKDAVDDLRDILDRRNAEAIDKAVPVDMPEFPGAIMHPGGGKIASKYCRFKIELDCAVILIADHAKYRGDWPNVKVEITGNHCLCYRGGAPEAYKDVMRFLEELGASIHKERVSRADLCADFPGWGMWRFINQAQKRRYTCRSRLYHPYLKEGSTSLYWGTGALILRVYDKKGEMMESALRGQPAKYQYMIEKRWGGIEPARAVRVEYQLRRDVLKGLGITDFDSLVTSNTVGDLVRYLTGSDGATLQRWSVDSNEYKVQKDAKWFRMLKRRPDKKHPERNITFPRWEIVQRVFSERFMCSETMVEIRPEESDITMLLKQAFGVLETAASNRGYAIPDKKTFAPEKFKFRNYQQFEIWFLANLRTVAAEKPGWGIGTPDREQDMIDRELEDMRLKNWEPSPDLLKLNELEKLIEDEHRLGAEGLI